MPKRRIVYLILHNIRSAENVGAIFRTADFAGVSKIFLIGQTPAPIDRFGRTRKDIHKSALGAELFVLWEYKKLITTLITSLKEKDFQIISIEQSPAARDYKNIRPGKKVVFIVGNEVTGLPKSVLRMSDAVAEIKRRGKKESLNVSVALGIALFRILNV